MGEARCLRNGSRAAAVVIVVQAAHGLRGVRAVVGDANGQELRARARDDRGGSAALVGESGVEGVGDIGDVGLSNTERSCGKPNLLDEVSDLLGAERHVPKGHVVSDCANALFGRRWLLTGERGTSLEFHRTWGIQGYRTQSSRAGDQSTGTNG